MSQRHEGERTAHRRFGVEEFWRDHDFDARFLDAMPPGVAAFVESLPFFFIATANAAGECDCSFRGREVDASGRAYPLLKVLDVHALVFPDFRGNRMFSSLGNMLVNPHIGMLFIDFEGRQRLRINGRVEIIDNANPHAALWPQAERCVRVTVEQVFGNCRARIPRMKLLSVTDSAWLEE